MAPIWSYQPFKGLFTAFVVATSPVYFAALAIYYLPPRLRPHPKWSLHTCVGRAFYYLLFLYAAKVRLAPAYVLKARSFKERFAMVYPSSKHLYTGVLEHPKIRPVPMGGLWFPNAPSAKDIEERKFVLHLPGGAYVICTSPGDTGKFPSSVYASELDAITFFGPYRVAAKEDTRFPAAIQDAVSYYAYLFDLGIPARNIIVSGDSAGGNLVLAFLRYIEDSNGVLPRPSGAISWSPWVDVSPAALSRYQRSERYHTDIVPKEILDWGLQAYPPPSSESSEEVQSYVSPVHRPFSTSTPLFVQTGTAEVFYDDIRVFAKEMAGIEGNQVKYRESPHAPHDIILCGHLLGMADEARNVVRIARQYFDSCAQAS